MAVTPATIYAARVWLRIQRNGTGITLRRAGSFLSEQMLYLSYDNGASLVGGEDAAATTYRRKVVLLGVRGHATVADTDVQQGDRFGLDGVNFAVESVIPTPGGVQVNAYQDQ